MAINVLTLDPANFALDAWDYPATIEDPYNYSAEIPNTCTAEFVGQPLLEGVAALTYGRIVGYTYGVRSFTCGAGDDVGDPVRLSGNDTVTQALATTAANAKVIGFIRHKGALGAASVGAGTTCWLDKYRYVSGLSGGTAGNPIYLTDAGGYSATAGTVVKVVGAFLTASTGWLHADEMWANAAAVFFNDAEGDPVLVNLTAAADGTSVHAARRDHRHLLDVAIAPTWTAKHIWNQASARDWSEWQLSGSPRFRLGVVAADTTQMALWFGSAAQADTNSVLASDGNFTVLNAPDATSNLHLRCGNTSYGIVNDNGFAIGSTAAATGTNVLMTSLGTVWTQVADAATFTAIDYAVADTRWVARTETGRDVWIGNGSIWCDNLAHNVTNYERAGIYWSANIAFFIGDAGGSGSSRAVKFGSVGSAATNFLICGGNNCFSWDVDRNILSNGNQGVIATTAINAFFYVPSCAGIPTGTPASLPTGNIPEIVDSTNNNRRWYSGSRWRGTPLKAFVAGDVTNDTATLADITGLTFTVEAAGIYKIQAVLNCTTGATLEGIQIAIAGTATVTNMIVDAFAETHESTPVIKGGRITAMAGTFDAGGLAVNGNLTVFLDGLVEINAAGTYKLQFAKSIDTGAANTTVKRGSSLWLDPS